MATARTDHAGTTTTTTTMNVKKLQHRLRQGRLSTHGVKTDLQKKLQVAVDTKVPYFTDAQLEEAKNQKMAALNKKKAAPNKKKAARPVLNVPPRGIGPITNPNENDVLSGRGGGRGGINSHLGNMQFRDIIHSQKSEYLDPSTKRDEKAHIAARIVSGIPSQRARIAAQRPL